MKRGICLLVMLLLALPQVVAAVELGEVVTKAKKITLGAAIRTRYENRYNHDFDDATPNSSDFTLLRTRLNIGMDVTDDVKAFVQIQDSRIFGANQNEADNGQSLDLRQGYVDVLEFAGLPMTLRVGRQTLVYGDQRLIGAFDWNNVGRAFDGARAMIRLTDNLQLDLFATKVAELDNAVGEQESITPFSPTLVSGNATAGADEDQNFYGAYAMWTPGRQVADFYLLYMEDNSPTVVPTRGIGAGTPLTTGTENIELWTLGTRLKGPLPALAGLDYGFEGAYQFGDGADLDISAFALHGELGYALPLFKKSRLSIEANWASGDDDPTDGDFNTFSNLFPTNHLHYGYMDRVGWSNARNYALKLDSQVTAKLKTKLHFWYFELAEEEDALYHAGGGTIFAAGAANGEREVGQEIDLVATYKYNQVLTFEAAYAHFFVGDAVENAKVEAADADFAYVQMNLKF
ncbi:hypothetical protein B5V00_12805 [Geothermobacter hydrogeniphilus]|uniref:Alginate export domain-containing protein n=2 Tax=Geothermobacter hydrogeniphilus TaxID=1969733 RepID=A0A1X0XXY5_9BACT|nr:hypothetical protein B5V00_12805 [Geothermobacter hydrogeniphilus]